MLDWIRLYQRAWLRSDAIAGLTTAAVVIPKAMAYATIAGLPVQTGLYTAFVPMLVYVIFGTSRSLSVSTTTTIAILTGAQLGQVVPTGDPLFLLSATATLAVLVGAILLLASFLRLGFIANFISEPVLIGFKTGIGFVIVLDQVPKLLGIHFHKGSFFHNLINLAQGVPDASVATLAVKERNSDEFVYMSEATGAEVERGTVVGGGRFTYGASSIGAIEYTIRRIF